MDDDDPTYYSTSRVMITDLIIIELSIADVEIIEW